MKSPNETTNSKKKKGTIVPAKQNNSGLTEQETEIPEKCKPLTNGSCISPVTIDY